MGHVDAGASRPLHEPRWQGILVWVIKVRLDGREF